MVTILRDTTVYQNLKEGSRISYSERRLLGSVQTVDVFAAHSSLLPPRVGNLAEIGFACRHCLDDAVILLRLVQLLFQQVDWLLKQHRIAFKQVVQHV